jgi:hypothetical protein
MDLNVISFVRQDVDSKFVASTNGGEYAGPCPVCGGKDRFRVWPREGAGGRFWCRQCGKSGDLIEYLRWNRNMTFRDACRIAGKALPLRRKMIVDHSWWKTGPQVKTTTPVNSDTICLT